MIYKTLHRRTDNTMAKRQRTNKRQYRSKDKEQTMSYKPLHRHLQNITQTGQTIQWLKDKEQTMIYKTLHRRTDNTMAKRQRTNNDLTDNTMVKRQRTNNDLQNITQKDRQYNGQKTKNKQ